MRTVPPSCSTYWNASDWLPLPELLERWCQGDPECWKAKWLAMISACERGEIEYRRSDGKDFDDPVPELAQRNLLLIGRETFNTWVTRFEGTPPPDLSDWQTAKGLTTPTPSWATDYPVKASNASVPAVADAIEEEKAQTAALESAPLTFKPVPSKRIMETFPVKTPEAANLTWWKTRMRNAKDYHLVGARVSAGRLNHSSQWNPALVAVWLHEKKHLKLDTLRRIMTREFPDQVDLLDYLENH